MANTKISALPAATTPTGSEMFPVVQGAATVRTTLAAIPVTSAMIQANAVGTTAIADNTITTAKIQDNAISTAKIQANAVGNARMAKANANTIKGNATAALADITDIAINNNSLIGRAANNIQNITLGTNMNLSGVGVLDSTTGGGGLGLRYAFGTALNATGIAAAEVRFNSATLNSVGHIYISTTDQDSRDLTTYFASFAQGGQLVMKAAANGDTSWAAFDVTSVTNQTTYFDITCTYALGANLFTAAENITMLYFPITTNQILKAGNFARFQSNGLGGYNLVDNTNSVVESVASVYTLVTIPAANTVPVGTTVALDGNSVLTGFGKSPIIFVYSDGTRWRPHSNRQVLYQGNYGTLAAPTLSITSATTFNLGTGGDPTIPANLLGVGSRLVIEAFEVKDGTTAPALRIYMGTSGTPSSNDFPYGQTLAATADLHCFTHNEIHVVTNTSAFSTCRTTIGGTAAGAARDVGGLFDVTAAMKISFGASTLSADTVKLLFFKVIWEY